MTRTASEIGAGLAPSRPARSILAGERIHILGIAGAGASAAALLAQAAGAIVTGCDPGAPSPYTPALDEAGIRVAVMHDPDHVTTPPVPHRVAVSKAVTAIAADHPELSAARRAGIAVEPWQQVIADCAVGRLLVGVAGTHGKSTSTGWLVHVLASAGADPSAFVGALLPASAVGGVAAPARIGRGRIFVVEADEYAGNFDPYRPQVAILTSAEWDHPDVFADRESVLGVFESWVRRMPADAVLVANVRDEGVAQIVERLGDWPGRVTRVSLAAEADVREHGNEPTVVGRVTHVDPAGTTVEIAGLGSDPRPVTVRLPTAGAHNVANALGVAAAAHALGIAVPDIVRGLASFPGIGRRLERKGERGGIVVYDDYGHHPTAIRATLEAIRQREPGRRIWAVYEPLTFHRTAALLGDFAAALAEADGVAIADIWAGRDPDTTIASAEGLADAVRALRPGITVAAPGSVDATAEWLAEHVRPGDGILVMGGGHSYRIGDRVLELLGAATP